MYLLQIRMLWLCVITVLSLLNEHHISASPSVAASSRNFTVDVTFPNNSDCCGHESTCKFNSLHNALNCISQNNTTVTILSSKVMLTSPIILSSCNHVKIVGLPYATISCKNQSYVLFQNSHNIVIESITWENCGLSCNPYIGQLTFYDNCSNITVNNSVFQYSSSVGVSFTAVNGDIIVQGSVFKFNTGNQQVGGMLVSTFSGSVNAYLHLVVNMSNFYSNNAMCTNDLQCSGGLYVSIYNISMGNVQIKNSNFTSHNVSGCGAIFITTDDTEELAIEINDVLFSDNFGILAGAVGLDIGVQSSSVSSSASLSFTSCKFTDNGGAVVHGIVNRCVQMSITNTLFSDNIPGWSSFEASNIIFELEGNCTTYLDVSDSTFQGNTINIFTISTCQTVLANFTNISLTNNIGPGGITVTNGKLCSDPDDVWDSAHSTTEQSQSLMLGGDHRIVFTDSTFTGNSEHSGVIYISTVAHSINITNCVFISNSAREGVIVIHNTNIAVRDSNFSDNHISGLYSLQGRITLLGHVKFQNNTASSGCGIVLMKNSDVTLESDCYVEFIGNFAVHYGGAMYVEVLHCSSGKILDEGKSVISFVNNSAGIAGDAVYFQILSSCEPTSDGNFLSSLRDLQCSNMSANSTFSCFEYMRSSPMTLISNDTSSCNSSDDECFFDTGVMLGQEITAPLKVIDYFNQTAEPTVFLFTSITDGYKLDRTSSKFIFIQNGFSGVIILGNDPGTSLTNITISLSTVQVSDTKQITLHLNVSLTGCHTGFVYEKKLRKCICFTKYGIIQCINNVRSMITRGYWFGYVKANGKDRVASLSTCPYNYCKFVKCSSDKSNLCMLDSDLQQQCHSHRTGVSCSECESSYTLSYDSTACVSNKQCTAGHTALVIILTVIYWIVIVIVVFVVLLSGMRLHHLFSIIYFYSIVDILIGNNLYISDEVFQTVTLLSSFAKLSPQFLGKLCLVKGLSGIDQLFIHYAHPLAILVLLIMITLVARNSLRVSSFISPVIIRAICLLLLLSYTSIASTSLSLLRHLEFTDIDTIYTYSSPNIKFFHDRHSLYGGVAVLCELMVGIGLPLLLILDPCISRKISLVRIKPLLDQFQGGYKDKYRWCSAFYLVCRQIIFLVVYLTTLSNYEQMNFVLLVVCAAIAMLHAWIQPYAKEGLNSLDEIILVSSVVMVGLSEATFSSEVLGKMITAVVFFPILCFAGFLFLHSSIKERIIFAILYIKNVLCCKAIHSIQDNGALDDYGQYDRSADSDDESQLLLPSDSVLKYVCSQH